MKFSDVRDRNGRQLFGSKTVQFANYIQVMDGTTELAFETRNVRVHWLNHGKLACRTKQFVVLTQKSLMY